MRRLFPLLLVCALTAVGVLAGCDASSTEPIQDPILFDGEIAALGRESHFFTLVSSGTIEIEVTRLQEKPVEGAEPLGFPLQVGLGVGRPIGELCRTTYSVLASEGTVVLLGLTGADFCFQVFDNGSLVGDLVAEYTVSVSSN